MTEGLAGSLGRRATFRGKGMQCIPVKLVVIEIHSVCLCGIVFGALRDLSSFFPTHGYMVPTCVRMMQSLCTSDISIASDSKSKFLCHTASAMFGDCQSLLDIP